MTEEEWLTCGDLRPMLVVVRRRSTDRKLRWFACACCRNIWHLLTDERSRNAVEVAEQFADGLASEEQLEDVNQSAQGASDEMYDRVFRSAEAVAVKLNLGPDSVHGAWECAINACAAASAAARSSDPDLDDGHETARSVVLAVGQHVAPFLFSEDCHPDLKERERAEREQEAAQSDLVRDIFGNPFRPVVFAPEWRSDTALSLARHIYEARDFAQMPILADALQDAGCTNADILSHCRDANQVHVRGCWVVDLVLGKT